jgi:hypothetical protein
MTSERVAPRDAVQPMEMGDKLVFAAAFAAAFAEACRDYSRGYPEGLPEEDVGRWQRAAAFAAAKQAFGATVGLKLAEISAAEQAEAADAGSVEATGAVLIAKVIEAYRAGFDVEGGVDCDYACDGMCGGAPECMTCEYGEDEDDVAGEDEEVVDPADLSPEEQAIIADAERTLGMPLNMVRTDGEGGHACVCSTCEKECEHRDQMLQAMAMLNKVRSGHHDA